jgi:hypothetical protein
VLRLGSCSIRVRSLAAPANVLQSLSALLDIHGRFILVVASFMCINFLTRKNGVPVVRYDRRTTERTTVFPVSRWRSDQEQSINQCFDQNSVDFVFQGAPKTRTVFTGSVRLKVETGKHSCRLNGW